MWLALGSKIALVFTDQIFNRPAFIHLRPHLTVVLFKHDGDIKSFHFPNTSFYELFLKFPVAI